MSKRHLTNLALLLAVPCTIQAVNKTDLLENQKKINALYAKKSQTRKLRNIVKNADFKDDKANWRLHHCNLIKRGGENVIELNQKTPKFTRLWQDIKIKLPQGTTVRLEAKIKVENIYNTPVQENKLPQLYMPFFGIVPKKRLYYPGQAGRGVYLKPSNGKFKKITLTYKVPAGATSLVPSVKLEHPFRVQVKEFKMFASITTKQEKQLGITLPSSPKKVVTNKSLIYQTAARRAKKWFKPQEIYPVVFPHTINIDGNKNDWQNIELSGNINYSIPRFAHPNDTNDLKSYFKATADNDFIYLLVVVKDDKLKFGKSNDYNNDSIEIFFSPTFNQNKKNGPLDFHMTIIPKSAELQEFHLAGTENYLAKFRPVIRSVKVKNGWGVEVAVPLNNDLFVIKPYDMLSIGLNIEINDNDSGRRDHKLSWCRDNKEAAWYNPSVLGAMLFLSDESRPIIPPTSASEFKSVEIIPIENKYPGSINIIRNGSFEDGERAWSVWYGAEGTRHDFGVTERKSFCADGRGLVQGKYGMRLLTHGFNVIPGEKYLCRFKVKTDSPSPLRVEVRTKNPNYAMKGIGTIKVKADDGWVSKTSSFVVPSDYLEIQNVVQLMFLSKNTPYRLWMDDIELYRYVPEKIDCNISFNSPTYAFPAGQLTNALLQLKTTSTHPRKINVKIAISDLFYNKPIENRVFELTLGKGMKQINIPLKIKDAGFYALRVYITTPDNNKTFVRETEFAIYHKPDAGAEISGACVSHHIYTKHGAQSIMAALAAIKINTVRIFVSRSQEYDDGKFNFDSFSTVVDAAVSNEISVVGCPKVFERVKRVPVNNLDNYEHYIRNLVKVNKGKVAVWEIGNEPNLWMGWPPRPDPYEYSLVLRSAYNVVKSEDPKALVSTAGFNKGKLAGYVEDFLKMNNGNFFDIFAFHPYDFLKNSTCENEIPQTVKAVAEYCTSPTIYDTESGIDNQSNKLAVEVLTKKIPMFLFWNIKRHYEWGVDRFASGHLWSYYGSPSSSYPAYAFINSMYANAKCEGQWKLGNDFKAIVFSSKKFRFTTIWRYSFNKKALVKIPVSNNVVVYDVFGNDISSRFKHQNGHLLINLNTQYPVYVCGVLPKYNDLIPPLKMPKASKHKKYESNVLLLPKQIRNAFNISLASGEINRIPMRVKNYSRRSRQVTLSASCSGVEAAFEPKKITVPPGKSINTTLVVKARKQGKFKLILDGHTDGIPLAPLPIAVDVSFDCILRNSGRFISLENNTAKEITGTLSCVSEIYNVTPYRVANLTIPAKSIKPQKVQVTPKRNRSGKISFPSDGIAIAEAKFTVGNKVYRQLLKFSIAGAERVKRVPRQNKSWLRLWSGEQNPISLSSFDNNVNSLDSRIILKYDAKHLYLAIEVNDRSHFQKSDGAYIGAGDSVIVGIDTNCDSTEKNYGKDDFECGFALRNNGKIIKYYWTGKYGLESAGPFKQSQALIFRKNKKTYYNLTIPISVLLKQGKKIGLAIKINDRDTKGNIKILKFGNGLGENRSAADFGTVYLR